MTVSPGKYFNPSAFESFQTGNGGGGTMYAGRELWHVCRWGRELCHVCREGGTSVMDAGREGPLPCMQRREGTLACMQVGEGMYAEESVMYAGGGGHVCRGVCHVCRGGAIMYADGGGKSVMQRINPIFSTVLSQNSKLLVIGQLRFRSTEHLMSNIHLHNTLRHVFSQHFANRGFTCA